MIYYFVRFVVRCVLLIDFALLTVLMYVLTFLPYFVLTTFYPRLFRFWCRCFVHALGVNLKLHQQNEKPIPKQFILIANHPSAFEDIGVPALYPVYSLAKQEVRNWWFFGRISWAAGTLYVKRESKDSRNAAAKEIETAINRGKSIALYPEGGCKGRRIFHAFRHGAFDISMTTGIPILPVFLHYEAQDDFEWRDPQTLIQKLWHFIVSQNSTANYYQFDAIFPERFRDKEEYNNYVHDLYVRWQAKYLE